MSVFVNPDRILSTTSLDADGFATAFGFSAEGPGVSHFSMNSRFNPAEPGKRHQRVITVAEHNVGIGKDFDVANPPTERLVVQGNIVATGDVRLEGADCAEEFPLADEEPFDPGTVMVIGDEERVRQCVVAYDTKVAGVISGAGGCRAGIILGRQPVSAARVPLALAGKVFCKVDAGYGPVAVGDLLTTSATPGHAMKALDPRQAFGAILGKALRPLGDGRGLIPVLVALQ